MNDFLNPPAHRFMAVVAAGFSFLALVDGMLPQLEMFALGGHVLAGNFPIKAALCFSLVAGCLLQPTIRTALLPMSTWLACILFLAVETGYLMVVDHLSLFDVLESYNAYYALLLVGPALLAFRGAISERVVTRCTIIIFLICSVIGMAQYVLNKPILYTESRDGSFMVASWDFQGSIRAFSLFSSAMEFGIFCALCGALGIALTLKSRISGGLLFILAGTSCFITQTRLCYVVFICAVVCAFVLAYGKKPSRAIWHPFLFFVFGVVIILGGVTSTFGGQTEGLQNAGSLLDRVMDWAYYSEMFIRSDLVSQLFGLGLVQNEKISGVSFLPIDNTALALILDIGAIGLLLLSVLMFKMWLYLRSLAISGRQPFVIAAASLWATIICAGMFNIVLSTFGAIFALVVLCENLPAHAHQIRRRSSL